MIISTSSTKAAADQAFGAALEGDLERVQELADYTFHMEQCDSQGRSLLHYAVQGGSLPLVRWLTQVCGLDPTWADHSLVTPYDLAHQASQSQGKLCEIEAFFQEFCGFSWEGCYRNPIVRGMYPDPSIVRVGEDYYMVNSSFIYFPSIPISHSRDLVHWNVIGYGITDAQWAREHLGPLEGGRGFWAPDISYHNGWFYICATLRQNDDAPCIQLQLVMRSRRPEGPYSQPVLHPVRGIDPSIFTDSDGRRYMLLNRGARIMEISEDGTACLSKPEMIWYGWDKHGPEGPHLLKKDGYYYCFLAEGGTGKGHKVTVARSRNLMGPYEDCPYNPIMTQKDSAGAIQCCGHGKPVSTPDGRWYMVYLCSRYLDGQWGMLGRETCLDEITWTEDGWPLVNQRRGPSYMAPLPFPERQGEREPKKELPYGGWTAPRTIDSRLVRIFDGSRVEIRGEGKDLCQKDCRSLVLKRQPDFDFTAEFELRLSGEKMVADTGMTLYYDENTYIKFGITESTVFVTEYIDQDYVRRVGMPFYGEEGPLIFRVETRGLTRSFFLNGREICTWDNVTSICSEGLVKGKRFTGAMYGVYNNGKNPVRWRQHGYI